MTDDIIGICVVIVLIGMIILGVIGVIVAHDENMAKLGYTQVMLPGKSDPVWVKEK